MKACSRALLIRSQGFSYSAGAKKYSNFLCLLTPLVANGQQPMYIVVCSDVSALLSDLVSAGARSPNSSISHFLVACGVSSGFLENRRSVSTQKSQLTVRSPIFVWSFSASCASWCSETTFFFAFCVFRDILFAEIAWGYAPTCLDRKRYPMVPQPE